MEWPTLHHCARWSRPCVMGFPRKVMVSLSQDLLGKRWYHLKVQMSTCATGLNWKAVSAEFGLSQYFIHVWLLMVQVYSTPINRPTQKGYFSNYWHFGLHTPLNTTWHPLDGLQTTDWRLGVPFKYFHSCKPMYIVWLVYTALTL